MSSVEQLVEKLDRKHSIRRMVRLRNEIAHGEMRPVTREEYYELKEFIQTALEGFKESIEEAARGRIYLKEPVE